MSGGPPTETFGPYLVYEQLGVGGMASVHRAESRGIEGFRRPVALKRMLPHIAANDDLVKSFVREARLASHLRHANVAQTFDLGRVDEIYFIAMELILGRDLRQILRKSSQTSTPIPVPVTLNILNQLCDALDYAHNLRDDSGQPLGIIHRDVSPSNIIVSESGVVKLIDFGIAKASAAGMQTMSGTLKGKFGYMAPEYIKGSIDARADLFALGVIAYELLTSKPLFSGRDDLDTLNRVQEMPIAPPSSKNPAVPAEIDDVVMTALARDPAMRWQHATALRNAMTTLTRRLNLVILNTQMVEWVSWLFDQTGKAPSTDPDPHLSIRVDSSDSSYTPVTDEPTPTPVTAIAPADYARIRAQSSAPPPNTTSTAASSNPHVMLPPVSPPLPTGTPSRMSAQRSIQPAPMDEPEYRAAVERFSARHDAVVPTDRRSDHGIEISQIATAPINALAASYPPRHDPSEAPTMMDVPSSANRTLLDPGASSRPVMRPNTASAPGIRLPSSAPNIVPPSAPNLMMPASSPQIRPPEPARNVALLALMIVVAAVAAASVVYFVLPLLT